MLKRLSHLSLLLLTVLLAVFVPVLALAQDVAAAAPAAPGAPGGLAWVTALIQYALVPLIPAIGAALVAALVKLSLFLHSKEQNNKVAGVFAVVTDFVEHAFEHVRAGLEPQLKEALADGVLSADERAALVQKLLNLLYAELPGGVMAALKSIFGAGLATWLSGKAQAVISAAAEPTVTAAASVTQNPQPT